MHQSHWEPCTSNVSSLQEAWWRRCQAGERWQVSEFCQRMAERLPFLQSICKPDKDPPFPPPINELPPICLLEQISRADKVAIKAFKKKKSQFN